MSQTQAPAAGGQFLTTAVNPKDVYVREDLTEEQRMFGQTAAEFMQKEVLPVVEQLYKHDWALTRQLLKKASDLDLLRLEIPAEYGGLGLGTTGTSYIFLGCILALVVWLTITRRDATEVAVTRA